MSGAAIRFFRKIVFIGVYEKLNFCIHRYARHIGTRLRGTSKARLTQTQLFIHPTVTSR
jgi:hypothetical protein